MKYWLLGVGAVLGFISALPFLLVIFLDVQNGGSLELIFKSFSWLQPLFFLEFIPLLIALVLLWRGIRRDSSQTNKSAFDIFLLGFGVLLLLLEGGVLLLSAGI